MLDAHMNTLMGTVEELILLAEVVEAGGFSAASGRTGIPKSRLSRRIAKLEERLGVGLIRRDSRHFEVTELGRQLYERACTIRESAVEAVGLAQDSVGEPTGLLRVACPVALATSLVTRIAASFVRQYPRVQLALTTTLGAADTLAERFDVIIHPSVGALPDSDMVARRLGVAQYALVATPELADTLALHDPEQLAGAETIGWDFMGRRGRWHLAGPAGRTADVNVSERLYSDNLLVVRAAVLEGAGVAPMSRFLCQSDIDAGRLQVVLPGWGPPPLTLYAIYGSRRALSTAGGRFINELVAQIAATGV
ncbi:LysR family transcriptional regulator [Aquincola sp. S2]|uniref:LysR family transcriptional regulator n=1 Tax=Pseudaquabacterium terrae TaxID=2732868 RepID=A0ABX2EQ11_9BURK|nr:LysR family transcriptional regulator [Aquabacterium terrae]NRF70616.1 LysR family transcriptional regulator [Aquabacterium terrae]